MEREQTGQEDSKTQPGRAVEQLIPLGIGPQRDMAVPRRSQPDTKFPVSINVVLQFLRGKRALPGMQARNLPTLLIRSMLQLKSQKMSCMRSAKQFASYPEQRNSKDSLRAGAFLADALQNNAGRKRINNAQSACGAENDTYKACLTWTLLAASFTS